MHDYALISTLAGGLTAALIGGYITYRLGLSPIVGYLMAGIVVGPYTPGFVADHKLADQLAEVGVILLMFGVGLHFHIEELLAVKRVAIPGAVVQSLVATGLGAAVARAFGWDWSAGLVFGMALSVASTVVLTRVLSDNNDLHTQAGHIAVGWLVVEDLFTVLILVLLPALFGPGAEGGLLPVLGAIALAFVKVAVLALIVLYAGGRIVPWLFSKAAGSGSREIFTLTVLVVALGIAVGSSEGFGVTMALGAFLAGMVVGRTEFSLRAAAEALPMRDAFAVLFFVSVGMMLDPKQILASPGLTVATLVVVMVGKPLAALVIMIRMKYPLQVAMSVAVALAQIGEFSFILAAVGRQLNVLSEAASHTLVAAAIVSITLNPPLYRLIDPAERWLSRHPRLGPWLKARSNGDLPTDTPRNAALSADRRAIVVGYGPVGRTVCRLLRENEVEPTVVEMNIETVRRLREKNEPAVYGDAAKRDTLVEAGIKSAGYFVLTSSGMAGSEEAVRLAKELNPEIRVLARTQYVREMPVLRKAGAKDVFSGEGEVALAVTETVLRQLGASPDQIDRERERVRNELLGTNPADVNATVRSGQENG